MLRRWSILIAAPTLLSGCLYAKQEVLDALPNENSCPFQENVVYEMFEFSDDHAEIAAGKVRFGKSENSKSCTLKDASDVSEGGSDIIQGVLESQAKYISNGVYVSYKPSGFDGSTGYNGIQFTTVYNNGVIEVRGSCVSAEGKASVIIPGIHKGEKGDTCNFDNEIELNRAVAANQDLVVSRLFRPARL